MYQIQLELLEVYKKAGISIKVPKAVHQMVL